MKLKLLMILLCISLSSCSIFRKVNKSTEEVKTEVKTEIKDSTITKVIINTTTVDTSCIEDIDIEIADTSKPVIINGVKYINIKRFKATKTKKGISYHIIKDSVSNTLKTVKQSSKIDLVKSNKTIDKKSFDFTFIIIILVILIYLKFRYDNY